MWISVDDTDAHEIRAVDNRGRNLAVKHLYAFNTNAVIGGWVEVLPDATKLAIEVYDRCGNTVHLKDIPLRINRPVTLFVDKAEWKDGFYYVEGAAHDPDLIECAQRRDVVENLTFTTAMVSSGGGEFTNPFGQSSWRVGCWYALDGKVGFTAVYWPPRRGKPRWIRLYIQVKDAWGAEDIWSKELTNDVPKINILGIPPSKSTVIVRYGDMVTATVVATDKEGDQVVLQKDFGPGDFPVVEGLGAASGTYTWTATTRQPWHVVRFSATEPDVEPPVPSYAYLFIRVLQPPQAYHGQITVPRNSTRTAFLYVEDPDTPPENLAFTFQTPPGLSVRLVSWARPRYFGIYYGSTMRVEVSVDKSLCDG
ncbi:MAG: hypothetical protein ABDI20_05170, partial [Candidatus Bipolaricaulaceae bacterium]